MKHIRKSKSFARRKPKEEIIIPAPQWIIDMVCEMDLLDIFNGMVRKPREYDLYPKKNYGDIKCLTADMNK